MISAVFDLRAANARLRQVAADSAPLATDSTAAEAVRRTHLCAQPRAIR
jgi:hypothetical protein